jgi:hypothetical protein
VTVCRSCLYDGAERIFCSPACERTERVFVAGWKAFWRGEARPQVPGARDDGFVAAATSRLPPHFGPVNVFFDRAFDAWAKVRAKGREKLGELSAGAKNALLRHVFGRAARRLSGARTWVQHHVAVTADGEIVDPDSPDAVAWSLEGAIGLGRLRELGSAEPAEIEAEEGARRLLARALSSCDADFARSRRWRARDPFRWAESPIRTVMEVRDLLHEAATLVGVL